MSDIFCIQWNIIYDIKLTSIVCLDLDVLAKSKAVRGRVDSVGELDW